MQIAASKKKDMWMAGFVLLGNEANGRTLRINEAKAETVRTVFRLYVEHGNVRRVKEEARPAVPDHQATYWNGRADAGRPAAQPRLHLQAPRQPDLCRTNRTQRCDLRRPAPCRPWRKGWSSGKTRLS